MKLLGVRCWGIAIPYKIQPGDISMGGGRDGTPYNTDGDPNLLGTDDDEGDSWLNANWDNLDNQWHELNGFAFAVSQLVSFQALPILGVFVFLLVPAIHPASAQFH
jgi:hypothetical protein